jgi:hypothetical protein|tara:strand:- start:48 stop:695 length:648 start_codon:yes stop_codon:yes gene_type:complete
MTSYAKVKWDIIEKWNSDAKYDNQYLIQMASDNGVEIRNERADRKSIVAKVADSVIKSGIESGDYSVTEWGTFSQEQINFENYMGSLGVPEPELDLDVDPDAHEHEHEHEDGTVHSHSHEEGHHDDEHEHEHEHDDGTVHSHPHSHDEEHSHDHEEESIIPVDLFNNKQQKQEEEHPDFKKMSKKALDVWAEEHGIILDRRKTKAHMIKELNKQL